MKFGLIGLGFIAPRHIAAIKHIGGEVLITCDIDKEKKMDGIPHYTHYEFMNADPAWKEVDTVVVLTPNDLHMEMAEWALRRKKKVICEKPLSINSMMLSRFSGVKDIYGVMQLRHHPVMAELKKQTVESGELFIKVKRGEDYWKGWKGDSRRSGGILFNIGIHYFDALFQLFGNNCHSITVDEKTPRRVVGTLGFYKVPNPIKFTIEVSESGEGQDRYLEINGTKYRFSDKDNLSFEDLHKKVYEEFTEGRGVRPSDLIDLTRFVEKISNHVYSL